MANTRRIAKSLGVTPAGLRFLAVMVAQGTAPQRGNEAAKLLDEDAIAGNPENSRYRNWRSVPFIVTDKGREIVRRARALGW